MKDGPLFSEDDLRAVVEAAAGDFAGATLVEHAREALDILTRVVQHSSMAVYLIHRDGPVVPLVQVGIDEKGLEDYPRHFVQFDPMQKEFGNPASLVSTLSGCARKQGVSLARNEYLQDFLLPRFGIGSILGSNFLLEDGVTFTFSLHRRKSAGDYTVRELGAMRVAMPHVARAMRVTHARERALELLRAASGDAPARDGPETSGLAVLGEDLRIQAATPIARRTLVELDDSGSLHEVLGVAASLVERLRAAPKRTFADASIVRRVHNGTASIRAVASRTGGESRITVHLFVDLVRSRLKLLIERVAEPYRLTAREVEVVALLHEGLKQPAIAERLAIGSTTVRDHLVAVRTKLGVKTNEQILVRLLGVS